MKKKLTDKQEKFAQLVVKYGNQSKAYREAYNVSDSTTTESVNVNASKLMADANIRLRAEEIREEAKKAHKIDRDWIINQHKEIIDWYKELKELARKENLDKEEKGRIYMLKDLIKGADFRGSLDSITKILGLNEPEKHEVSLVDYSKLDNDTLNKIWSARDKQ